MNVFSWDAREANPALSYLYTCQPQSLSQPICRPSPQREACWNSSFLVAMAYVPWQQWQTTYALKEALSRDYFPLTWIYSLIYGEVRKMMNQMMKSDFNASREAMLREVNQAGFAVVDANFITLTLHPCDAAAIDYYNQMANAYRNAAAAFEAQRLDL